MKRLTFFVFLFFVTFSFAQERQIEVVLKDTNYNLKNRTALVIGNARYKEAPLRNPANDAQDMATVLKQLKFNVEVLIDGDQVQMGEAIGNFGKSLRKRKGVGLFFYAGHGMQVNGKNYLIPIDSGIEDDDEVQYKAIDAGLVLSKMERAGNPMNMVFLDACRNNPFARSFRSAYRGLAQMDAPNGSLIVYATAPGSVAADGTGRNGVFTKHLIQNMRVPNVDVEMMLRAVRIGVLQETNDRQTPWSSSSLQGSFAFAGKASIQADSNPPSSDSAFNADQETWHFIKNSRNPNDFKEYLKTFPRGKYAAIARIQLDRLEQKEKKRFCHKISSRKGWQIIKFPQQVREVISISGEWSVDDRNYKRVGPRGHIGPAKKRLAPYSQYKYDRAYPFGALLMGVTPGNFEWADRPKSLSQPTKKLMIRINDSDRTLGDNAGALTICFGN